MDAWIDCLTSSDAPEDGMSNVHCEPETVLTLELENVEAFANRCPEQYKALIECSAFVNWLRLERGNPSVLALSLLGNIRWFLIGKVELLAALRRRTCR